jgi:hypothetical protein
MTISQFGSSISIVNSATLDLSSLKPGRGDFVWVLAFDDSNTVWSSNPTDDGFTEAIQFGTTSGGDRRHGGWYIEETDPFTSLPTVTFSPTPEAILAFMLRGIDTTVPLDTVTPTTTTGSHTPPLITTVTDNAHVLATCGVRDGATYSTPPSGYATLGSVDAGGHENIGAALSPAITPAGAEDPGDFGWISGGQSCAASIVLRPASAPSTPAFAAPPSSVAVPHSIRS